jgi:hypothetical protein
METTHTPQVPGQQTLPDMAEEMGYVTIAVKPSEERFCWAYVRNGGNGVKAMQQLLPQLTYTKAANRAHEYQKKPEIVQRIKQIRDEIGREELQGIKDFIHGSLHFDPASAFAGKERRHITEMDESVRKLCSLEARVLSDGSVVYLPVFPDKVKAQAELAKMMGAYAPDKQELSGNANLTVTSIVRRIIGGDGT